LTTARASGVISASRAASRTRSTFWNRVVDVLVGSTDAIVNCLVILVKGGQACITVDVNYSAGHVLTAGAGKWTRLAISAAGDVVDGYAFFTDCCR